MVYKNADSNVIHMCSDCPFLTREHIEVNVETDKLTGYCRLGDQEVDICSPTCSAIVDTIDQQIGS